MKILHTADWHLGNTFHGHNRLLEHRHFLNWLLGVIKEQQPDALIVSGDVFDSANPSAAAEELLYDFLLHATLVVPGLQVVITAGNHDSAGRLEAPAALLKTHNVYVRGTVHYLPNGEPDFDYYLLPLANRKSGQAACMCVALPYLRGGDYPAGMTPEQGLAFFMDEVHKKLRKSPFKSLPVIVAAHFYAAGADICQDDHSERLVVGGQDCVNVSVVDDNFPTACYTALGHIHKAQPVKGGHNAYYSGSALPMSFSEINYRHGINLVDIDPNGEAQVEQIDYEPLRKLQTIPAKGRAASVEEVFQEIENLPKRKDKDNGDTWPYLEIHIEEKQPEPTLMHDIMLALQDKAVHFCRIKRLHSQKIDDEREKDALNTDTLSAINPLELAQSFFKKRYDADMPEPLLERFRQASEPEA